MRGLPETRAQASQPGQAPWIACAGRENDHEVALFVLCGHCLSVADLTCDSLIGFLRSSIF